MLIKSIKMQLTLMLHKKGFQLAFFLVFLYVIITYLYYIFKLWGYDVSDMYHPAVLSALNSDSEYSWFFMMYYPFLVVLPSGFLFITDRNTNIYIIMQTRQSISCYYIAKTIGAFIGGFLVFTVPFLIGLLLNIAAFPVHATGTLTNMDLYSENYYNYASNYLFTELYFRNIYLYYIVKILLFGGFSGVVSVFLAAVSTCKIKYKIFMFLPFYLIVYFLRQCKFFFPEMKIEFGYEWYLLASDAVPNKKIMLMFLVVLFMLVISIIIILRRIKRDQLL